MAASAHRTAPLEHEDSDADARRAITIDCDVLTAPGTDLRIVMYTDSQDASTLALLRVQGTRALTS